MGRAVWRVTEKPKKYVIFWGMSVFAEKNMCAFQRSSGLVVIRRGSSGSRMVPYGSVYQSYTDTGQSSDPSGLVRSCQGPSGPVWFRIGRYISRTLIRDSRVIRQGSSGPVGPYRVLTGFHRNPVLAQRHPSGLDGSLDCSVSMHD